MATMPESREFHSDYFHEVQTLDGLDYRKIPSYADLMDPLNVAGEKAELIWASVRDAGIGLPEKQQNSVGNHILDPDRNCFAFRLGVLRMFEVRGKEECAVARDHASRNATSGSTRLALRAGR
jgi:hypothetical protein